MRVLPGYRGVFRPSARPTAEHRRRQQDADHRDHGAGKPSYLVAEDRDEQHIGARGRLGECNRPIELAVGQPVALLDEVAMHFGRNRHRPRRPTASKGPGSAGTVPADRHRLPPRSCIDLLTRNAPAGRTPTLTPRPSTTHTRGRRSTATATKLANRSAAQMPAPIGLLRKAPSSLAAIATMRPAATAPCRARPPRPPESPRTGCEPRPTREPG